MRCQSERPWISVFHYRHRSIGRQVSEYCHIYLYLLNKHVSSKPLVYCEPTVDNEASIMTSKVGNTIYKDTVEAADSH